MASDFVANLETQFEAAKNYRPNKADWLEGAWAGFEPAPDLTRDDRRGDTAVPLDMLREVGRALVTVPEGFHLNRKLARQFEAKRAAIESGEGIDWATAEALAIGTLCAEGTHVRMSGQDSGRGTFSHRHAVLVDQETEAALRPDQPHQRGPGAVRDHRQPAVGSRRGRVRIRLQPRRPEDAGDLGGAVRRFRERRAGHHRPVPVVGRSEVAAHERPRAAVAARLRGPGAGAFLGAARALSAALRRGQHAGLQHHDRGELFPRAAAADPAQIPQAAGRRHAEIAAARQGGRVAARRFRAGHDFSPGHRRDRDDRGPTTRCAASCCAAARSISTW